MSGYASPLFTSTAPDASPLPTYIDALHQKPSSSAHCFRLRDRTQRYRRVADGIAAVLSSRRHVVWAFSLEVTSFAEEVMELFISLSRRLVAGLLISLTWCAFAHADELEGTWRLVS